MVKYLAIVCLVVCALLARTAACCAQSRLPTAPVASQTTAAEAPVYWSEETFRIPYRWNSANDPNTAQTVKLYLSQDRGQTWNEISTAKPEVQYFTYHAPADGEYWFAMQTIDNQGRVWPEGPQQPELRVVVDTENPQVLAFEAALSATGEVAATWQAGDRHLNANAAKLQYRTPGDQSWQDVKSGSLRQPAVGVASGHARWKVPAGTKSVWVRLAVRDRAGNGREAGAEARVRAAADSQLASAAPIGPPANAVGTAQPKWTSQASNMRRPLRLNAPQTQAWPSDGTSPVPFGAPSRDQGPDLTAPSLATDAKLPSQYPAQRKSLRRMPPPAGTPLVNGGVATKSPFQLPRSRQNSSAEGRASLPTHTASASPFAGMSPPELVSRGASAPESYASVPNRNTPQSGSMPPAPQSVQAASPASIQQLNSLDFEIGYDVNASGTFGVTRVELWATPDDGRSWKRLSVDSDNRSPILGAVDREGDYGLKVVVETAGGLGAIRPRPGDVPDMRVRIDTTPPKVKLTGIQQGTQHLASHLMVEWQSDSEVASYGPQHETATLSYSAQPTGPWVVGAANLPNNGQYHWRLARHLPTQFYLRLEVEDQAGNVGADTTAVPVRINLPSAKVRLESARPVSVQ